MQLSVTVDLTTILPRLSQQLCLATIFNSPLAEWLLRPGIEATGMNTQHPAHDTDGELYLMRFDEHVLHSLPGRRCSHRREGCILGEIRGGFF